MNNRYSIYDQLNTGRQRKSATSLDDLEATIGGIEARLEKMRGRSDANPASYSDEIADRMRRLSNDVSASNRLAPASQSSSNRDMDRIAREVERARAEEAQHGHMASVMGELQQLRGEMRKLTAKPQEDWGTALRHEIETIRQGIASLAKEDTLRSVESRWSQASQAKPYTISDDPVIESLLDRIDGIQNAVNGLPQSLSISSLEEKVRVLASAIDQMSRRAPDIAPQQLVQIEDRLDEISRAIVASSVSVQAVGNDKLAFERIEARLGSLNSRLDEFVNAAPGLDLEDRIGKLALHMDQIASNAGAPTEQMVRMASQMEIIADKLQQLDSRNQDTETFARAMEDRLFEVAKRLELSHSENGRESLSILSELEVRLEDMAAKLAAPVVADNSDHILATVEQRFSDLSRQINATQPDNSIDPVFAANIEKRLAEITSRLNHSTAAAPAGDPEAIARLESQVTRLSQQLASPAPQSTAIEQLAPRLESIERNLADNHEALLAVARQAAEDALRNASLSGENSADSEAVYQLANDLKALDILARKSDDRNAKTFEAIHDTLLKIVDRLGSLEAKPAVASPNVSHASYVQEPVLQATVARQVETKVDLGASVPAFDMTDYAATDTVEDFEPMPVRSPAEAALAAANAAREMSVALDANPKTQKAKGGLLSGLTKALRREEKETTAVLAGSNLPGTDTIVAAPITMAADSVNAADPTSGAPDLDAIMKRVRDERKGRSDGKPEDNAKSDFLAAARRAAQAAAADAEILKNKNAKSAKSSSGGLSDILQRQRKPILMGALAIMLALTGLQLGKAFFGGSSEDATVVSDVAPAAAVDDAMKPAQSPDVQAAMPSQPTANDASAPAAADVSTDDLGAGEPEAEKVRVVAPSADVTEVATDAPSTSVPDPQKTSAASTEMDSSASAPMPTDGVTTQPSTPMAAAPASPTATDAVPADVGPLALREAASTGDAKAMFEIASRYAEGRGLAKDTKKAVEWYQKAADAGFAPAQFRLGSFYEKGIGVDRSGDKAKTLYQLAAEQGNASAMHNLAVLFATGVAGPSDNESAARWFLKAAELGVKDSQVNLGILAAKGLGIQQNLEESYKWFALAAKSGDKDAASKRDQIANALRPEQLQKARATTELWRAKPLETEANSVDVPESWTADTATTASTAPADMVKAIRNIQIVLNQNGYDAGEPDGKIGGKTKAAIAAYQKANGMAATGEVDDELVQSLLKKIKS